MSARGVLTVVGQVVGAYFGGPYGAAFGGAVGGFIGGEIDGPQKAQGPRLADTKMPTVSQGAPMPYLEGAQRLPLNPLWISARREIATTTNEGGKGSDATTDVTTYTYEVDILYWVTSNPIGGVRRIWDNGKLIWTQADDSPGSSLAASGGAPVHGLTPATSPLDKWRRLTVYTGGPDQQPDPTYEAAIGIGDVPAYRERGTVFIEGLQLGSSGQLPLLTAEVLSQATSGESVETLVSNSQALGYQSFFGSPAPSATRLTVDVPDWDTAYADDGYSVYSVNLVASSTTAAGSSSGGTVESASVVAHGSSDVGFLLIGADAAFGHPVPSYLINGNASSELIPADSSMTSAEDLRYALSGGTLVIGSVSQGTKALHRHSSSGAHQLSSANLAEHVQWLSISGSTLWALGKTTSLYELDLATMTLTATHALPTGSPQLLCIDAGGQPVAYMQATSTAIAYTWDGSAWTQSYGPGMAPLNAGGVGGYIAGSTLVTLSGELVLGAYKLHVRRNDPVIGLDPPDLADVVSRQCVRAGLTTGQIDVTALVGIPVRGMAVTQVTPVRTVLGNLMGAYLFEAVESGGKVKFVLRGGASNRTLTLAEMGASRGDAKEPLPMRRLNPIERPARVTLRFANALDDYQDGAESSDRLVDQGNGVQVTELPIVLTRTEAKRLAEVALADITNSRFSFGPVCLNNDHVALEPTDVVTLTDVDANTFRARITRSTSAAGVHEHELVLDDANVLTSASVSVGSNDTNSVTVAAGVDTVLLLLDAPLLRDADNGLGLYVAAQGELTPWPGAGVLKSTDDITYTRVVTMTASAVFGVCETVLANWTGGNRLDTVNTLDVDVGAGTLASTTYDALLDTPETNALLVGSQGSYEVIKFRVATLLGAGRYRLSDLLRGRRGTEWAMAGHVADEPVVLLQATTLRRILLGTAELSALRYYKGVTLGRSESTADAQPLTAAGVSQKPWAPVDLRGSRASGDLTATWVRRTRMDTNFTNGAVPLGEDAEAYSIDVFDDNTYTTVVRTLTATSPSVAYTAAQQTTDFGSPQATVYLGIHQLSALVGRGYALQGAL